MRYYLESYDRYKVRVDEDAFSLALETGLYEEVSATPEEITLREIKPRRSASMQLRREMIPSNEEIPYGWKEAG